MAETIRQLVYASRSEIGLKRKVNEDSAAEHVPDAESSEAAHGAMFIVADGIGSIGGGDTASKWAVKTFQDTYYDPELDDEHVRERVLAAIQDAQEAVKARARVLKLDSLGTTLTGVVILPDSTACIFNVGDSRVYLLRGETLEQITVDQSGVDPKGDPNRPKLTSYLGQRQPILPNLYERQLEEGDTLLICSDGLWGMLQHDEIASIVRRLPPQAAVDKLIERVYETGARDNVTISIVQHGEARKTPSRLPLPLILALMVILIAAVATFALLSQNRTQQLVAATPSEVILASAEPSVTTTPAAGLTTHIAATSTPRSLSVTATDDNGSSLVARTSTPSAGN
jgi:serine/threonine protein phosphatase PrpC